MKNLFLGVAVLVVVAIGAVLFLNSQNNTKKIPTSLSDETMANKTAKDSESMMEKKPAVESGASMYSGAVLAGSTTPFLTFSKADYGKAVSEGKIILLDFYANWCPICRAEAPEWVAAFNNLNVPNAVGFKVNYNDSETDQDEKDLAKQFGVTYQHTKVLLKNGTVVEKVTEQWDAAQIQSVVEDASK
ncbi:MAG: thioredoxin family protein [Candidatus Levybacteria bacterium]|nr:thioredoxin family protein [Candidatus Levybacteria bacterium]